MERLFSFIVVLIIVSLNATMSQCAVHSLNSADSKDSIPKNAHIIESTDSCSASMSVRNPHILNLSTQPLILAVGIPNVEVDFQLSNRFSLSMNVGYAPWFISSKFAPRCLVLFPEARYWVSSFGRGPFVGLHLNTAWYNLKLGSYRYQDPNFPALGGGITLGYQIPISESCSLRLDLGAGYTYLKYDRYHNVYNGAKIDRRKTSYVGIDRFSIAFAYSIPL